MEQQNGSIHTQVVYGPDGGKLALMNGQSLVKAFVPLPGGATAVYNSSGLAYYRHSDWLGSSRLTSSPSRQWLYDGAYAPFGESYAEATNSGGTIDHSFTGQNEDTVSGLDDFLFREYSSSQQGRWIRPDPAGLAVVNPANPQSWNRYAYALNMPCEIRDWLGLCTLNIAMTGSALGQLSAQALQGLEATVQSIYNNAGVGVSFSSASADFTVELTSTPNVNLFLPQSQQRDYGYAGGITGANNVWLMYNQFISSSSNLGLALGRVASHELGHKILLNGAHHGRNHAAWGEHNSSSL